MGQRRAGFGLLPAGHQEPADAGRPPRGHRHTPAGAGGHGSGCGRLLEGGEFLFDFEFDVIDVIVKYGDEGNLYLGFVQYQ